MTQYMSGLRVSTLSPFYSIHTLPFLQYPHSPLSTVSTLSPFYSADVVFTCRTYIYEYTWSAVWMSQYLSDFSVNDSVYLWSESEWVISLISVWMTQCISDLVWMTQYLSDFNVNGSIYRWFVSDSAYLLFQCECLSICLISVWMTQHLSDFRVPINCPNT